MVFLASDVTAKVREHIQAFYKDSNPFALELVNEAHTTLVHECGLYQRASIDVPITAGQGLYALNDDVFMVTSATYMDSATSFSPLWESSVSELDHTIKTWESQLPSRPSRYYMDGSTVGFWPIPNTTTSGSYPIVRLRVMNRQALTSLASALPPMIPTMQAYVWQVCYLWALQNDDTQVQKFSALADLATKNLMKFMNARLVRGKSKVAPVFPRIRNR